MAEQKGQEPQEAPHQPWHAMLMEGHPQQDFTLDVYFRKYSEATSPIEREGLIRGVMRVDGTPQEPDRTDLRQRIVEFLCDVGERGDVHTHELQSAARMTLARHVCPHITDHEYLATYATLVQFYGTVYQGGGLYEREIQILRECTVRVHRGIRAQIAAPTADEHDPAWQLLAEFTTRLAFLNWCDELRLARAYTAIPLLYKRIRTGFMTDRELTYDWEHVELHHVNGRFADSLYRSDVCDRIEDDLWAIMVVGGQPTSNPVVRPEAIHERLMREALLSLTATFVHEIEIECVYSDMA